jgi:predicted nucleic acid-binding protein
VDHEINALIRLDAWLERGEGDSVPINLLRERGIDIEDPSALDLIGGGSEEDTRIFLTYYADEDDRRRWQDGSGAGLLRGKLIAAGHKSRVADALVTQSCLDHDVALVRHDRDFRHYTRYGLILV